jgi:hypothetical protein
MNMRELLLFACTGLIVGIMFALPMSCIAFWYSGW